MFCTHIYILCIYARIIIDREEEEGIHKYKYIHLYITKI